MTYEPQEGIDYITDLYAISGVEPDTNETDLKTALNERLLEYHPDRLTGLAPEFKERGERMARLLNRARTILLDTEKRREYDHILATWNGPISSSGIPVITIQRHMQAEMEGKTPEEIEMVFVGQKEKIDQLSGYDPQRLSFLETLIAEQSGTIPDALRQQYESALLEKDRVLAIEQSERAHLLGLLDISKTQYAATLNYGEDIAWQIESAKAATIKQLKLEAIGGVSTRLALLSGETDVRTQEIIETTGTPELPAYYEQQAEIVQKIADERQEIVDKRLGNYSPNYPEPELQAELRTSRSLIIGVASKDREIFWIGLYIKDKDSAAGEDIADEVKALLEASDYKKVIERGYGLAIIEPLEQIDIQELIGVTVGKYVERFKEGDSVYDDAETSEELKFPEYKTEFDTDEEALEYINHILAGSMNPRGIKNWWGRARHQLGGRSPSEAWNEDRQKVIELAYGGLGQSAT